MNRRGVDSSLLNFADSRLGTQICSSALTVDGSEAKNLINKLNKAFHAPQCFISEYYIKCPIEVTLAFPCLVHISAIILEPKVSSHRSKCVEIYSAFQKVLKPPQDNHTAYISKKRKAAENSDVTRNMQYPCQYKIDFLQSDIKDSNTQLLNLLGKYKDVRPGLDGLPDRVIFRNPRHETQYCSETLSDTIQFDLRTYASVKACSHLIVRITWASIPVLKKLEVWGTPSSYNPSGIISHVYKISLASSEIERNSSDSSHACSSLPEPSQPKVQTNVKDASHSGNIPKEFIDPITCNVMTVPMLLPSGNTIDRHTLEKYSAEEEKFGRLPSDPFTGIVFHDGKKPVPNSSLKSRIDKFLLENSHSLDLDGRSVGTISKNSKSTVNMLKHGHQSKKRTLPGTTNSTMLVKNSISISNKDGNHDLLSKGDGSHSSNSWATTSNHEAILKDSLDLSLFKTLSSLPVKYGNDAVNTDATCQKCLSREEQSLFRLPCAHICCRDCVQKILSESKHCTTCGKPFQRKGVVKYLLT